MRERISKVKKNIEVHMEWAKGTHYAGVTHEELKEIESVIVELDEQVYQFSKLIEKDKHFLIKSNINLNRKVQELEHRAEVLSQTINDIPDIYKNYNKKLLEKNKRYRELLEKTHRLAGIKKEIDYDLWKMIDTELEGEE